MEVLRWRNRSGPQDGNFILKDSQGTRNSHGSQRYYVLTEGRMHDHRHELSGMRSGWGPSFYLEWPTLCWSGFVCTYVVIRIQHPRKSGILNHVHPLGLCCTDGIAGVTSSLIKQNYTREQPTSRTNPSQEWIFLLLCHAEKHPISQQSYVGRT